VRSYDSKRRALVRAAWEARRISRSGLSPILLTSVRARYALIRKELSVMPKFKKIDRRGI